MKKKLFASKLQFQKTTIVSFNKLTNIVGGTLQNTDTRVVSVDGYMCLTHFECVTQNDKHTCLSCTDTECTRPTNTSGGMTDFCGNTPLETKVNWMDSRFC